MSQDFRNLLQEELVRRIGVNARYSMRAYARSLKTDFSTLAKILRGERPLGTKSILRIGTELGLAPQEIEKFVQPSKTKKASGAAASTVQYRLLSTDHHHIAKDWYHDAILELMRVKAFEGSIPWISKVLGVSTTEVRLAVERLQRAELLKIDESGAWHDISGGKTTILGDPALKALGKARMRHALQKAIDALDEVAPEDRDQTSITVAIDKNRLAEAKRRIQSFRRELAADLCSSKNLHEVYHLSVSLIPVTKIGNKSRSSK